MLQCAVFVSQEPRDVFCCDGIARQGTSDRRNVLDPVGNALCQWLSDGLSRNDGNDGRCVLG